VAFGVRYRTVITQIAGETSVADKPDLLTAQSWRRS
jgi:hypothetical protein